MRLLRGAEPRGAGARTLRRQVGQKVSFTSVEPNFVQSECDERLGRQGDMLLRVF